MQLLKMKACGIENLRTALWDLKNHREIMKSKKLYDDRINFSVDKTLKDTFSAICRKNRDVPSILFRQFMKKYINKNKSKL